MSIHSGLRVISVDRPVQSVVATTDFHSHLERANALVGSLRSRRARSAVVDAGDFFEGTHFYRLGGGALESGLLRDEYDIVVPGNHGWTHYVHGPLSRLTLLSNVTRNDGSTPFAHAARLRVNGAWVILVGVIGEDAYSAIPLGERNGWIWHDPLRTINAIAAKFDEARVCVISHSGLKADRRLAELVTCDVLFSGHCHTNPPAPVRHSGTWIAQAPDHGRGTAEATFDGSTWRVEHNLLIEGHSSRSTGIGQQVERLSAEGNVVIGHVHPRWLRHPDRRALVLALAQRASQYSALPALLNETALRPGLLRGVLRRRDLLDLEPFNNRLVLLPLPDDGSAAIERMLASGLLPVSYGDIVVGSEFVTTSYLAANYFAGASGTTVCDLTDVLARVLIEGAG